MACCDWDTFTDSFLAAWRKRGGGELLIDWKRAKRDWRRHHCTGGEAASMQLRVLCSEAAYLWFGRQDDSDDGGDAGGPEVSHPRPPLPVAA